MTALTDADRLREIASSLPLYCYAVADEIKAIANEVQRMQEVLDGLAEQARLDAAEMGQVLPFLRKQRVVRVFMAHETPDGAA